MTFGLHLISDRISFHLLITDTSDFVKRWKMILEDTQNIKEQKRLLVKVKNGFFPIELCGLLLKFDDLSMFWNILFPKDRLFYKHSYSTREERYRPSHAIPSNRPTEVSIWVLNLVNSRQFYSKTTCINFTREKGRYLTQSCDKIPYTNRNVKWAMWQYKRRHKRVRLHGGCGPT